MNKNVNPQGHINQVRRAMKSYRFAFASLVLFVLTTYPTCSVLCCDVVTTTLTFCSVKNASSSKTEAEIDSMLAGGIAYATANTLDAIHVTIACPASVDSGTVITQVNTGNILQIGEMFGNKWKDDGIPLLIVDDIAGTDGATPIFYKDGYVTFKLIILESAYASQARCGNVVLHELGHIVGLCQVGDSTNVMNAPVAGTKWGLSSDIYETFQDVPEEYSARSDHRVQGTHYHDYNTWNGQFNGNPWN